MAMGMTYEQFWYGSPGMVKAFKEAHRVRNDQLNQQMWLQGLYFYNAVASALARAFGDRNAKYVSKPLELFEKPKPKMTESQIEDEREKFAKMLEKRFGKLPKHIEKGVDDIDGRSIEPDN